MRNITVEFDCSYIHALYEPKCRMNYLLIYLKRKDLDNSKLASIPKTSKMCGKTQYF